VQFVFRIVLEKISNVSKFLLSRGSKYIHIIVIILVLSTNFIFSREENPS